MNSKCKKYQMNERKESLPNDDYIGETPPSAANLG